MSVKILAGYPVDLNDEGYFTKPEQWNKDVAQEVAKEESINLSEDHYKVLNFLRDSYNNKENITIRRVGNSGVTTIKDFYKLFPGAPLKKASKIAGIPKPASCI